MLSRWICSVALVLAGAGCSDPGEGKPAAQVSPSAASNDAVPASSGGRVWTLSPEPSRIGFQASKVTRTHTGGFKAWRGEIRMPEDGPIEDGRVQVEIDMASVDTDASMLTDHLMTGDFFLVEEHPTATFTSTGIKPDASGQDLFSVTGDLTLRGVTKSVTFPATIKRTGETLQVEAEFTLNRQDFGIAYPGMPDDLIRDNVVVQLDLRADGGA